MTLGEWILLICFLLVFSLISGMIQKVDFKKLKRPSLKIRGRKLGLRRGKTDPFLFEIVTLREYSNKHEFTRGSKLEFKHETQIDNKKVEREIKPEDLYIVKPALFQRMINLVKGIKIHFLVLFVHGKKQPVKYSDPAVTPRTLKIVNESRALSQALKDEFKKAFDTRIIMFIIPAVIIGAVIYFYMRGQRLI